METRKGSWGIGRMRFRVRAENAFPLVGGHQVGLLNLAISARKSPLGIET